LRLRKELKLSQIMCSRRASCTFRVDAGYFERKVRFWPGACPTCGGPLAVVEDWTDKPTGERVDMDPNSRGFRKVVPV